MIGSIYCSRRDFQISENKIKRELLVKLIFGTTLSTIKNVGCRMQKDRSMKGYGKER